MTLRSPEFNEILFYRASRLRLWLAVFLCVLVPFLVPVLMWRPEWLTRLTRRKTLVAGECDYVLVRHTCNWLEIAVSKRVVGARLIHSFQFRKLIGCVFECVAYNLAHMALQEIHLYGNGLSSKEAAHRLAVYGPNTIDVERVSVRRLVLRKLCHPFYLFQIASVAIWFANGYPLYASIITCMSLLSAIYEIWSEKRNEHNLRLLVHLHSQVTAVRDGKSVLIDTVDLVVGDAVLITPDMQLVCDLVLLRGQCIVDESSISGESAPIVKSSLPDTNALYQQDLYRSNTLFSGSVVTYVADDDDTAVAIVMSSGFDCTKGDLFRAIIYPEEIDFKFNRQSHYFLKFMACVAMLAFVFKMVTGYGITNQTDCSFHNGESFRTIILNSLDMITITVPPALPLVLSLGIGFSMKRLKQMGIFCINSERINLAGWIDVVCWDKTGTLTDDQLEYQGFDEVVKGTFSGFTAEISASRKLIRSMAVCHSVHVIGGKLVGHFVDKEMFRATKYRLSLPPSINSDPDSKFCQGNIKIAAKITCADNKQEFLIVKRFDFDAHIQLASVIYTARDIGSSSSDSFFLCAKGSPEAILKVCVKDSIPIEYRDTYKRYSGQGFYVIAFAEKCFDDILDVTEASLSTLTRGKVECNLRFCGFAVFRSPIKPESYDTIKQLGAASIRSTIITGDNGLTAINVARQLNMGKRFLFVNKHEDSNAVTFSEIPYTDEEWSITYLERPIELLPSVVRKYAHDCSIAVNCHALNHILDNYEDTFVDWFMETAMIFSRAKPRDKTRIVQKLIRMGHYVMMTGDGTNDCGALKAAHVGVALSDTEASIVAPFSSRSKSVDDIPKILAEGRCALVTSFSAFQYLAVYPIVQLLSSCIAVYFHTQMADGQYLFDDVGLVFGLATFMLYSKPRRVLSNETPVKSLFSINVLASFIGQILINILFTTVAIVFMRNQDWYCDARFAQSRLGRDYTPIDKSLPFERNYPCYYIDPERDVNYETIISTYETTFPWLYSHFQFIISAVCLGLSTRFRRPIRSNVYFLTWIIITTSMCLALLLIGHDNALFPYLEWAFQLRDTENVPASFRYHLLVLVFLNFIICVLWEKTIVQGVIAKRTALKAKLAKLELTKDIPDVERVRRVELAVPCKLKQKGV